MTAKPDSSDSLVFECDFDEPPEKVWRALTEPELLEAWLVKDGSRETNSRDARATDCEILSAEPHTRLRYRWRDRESGRGEGGEPREVDSVVTVELTPGSEGGTHLRLTHGDFRIVSSALRKTAVRVIPFAGARRRGIQATSGGAPIFLRRAA